MIKKILGGLYLSDEAAPLCGCNCECYPEPRGGDYSQGYFMGAGVGARDTPMMDG